MSEKKLSFNSKRKYFFITVAILLLFLGGFNLWSRLNSVKDRIFIHNSALASNQTITNYFNSKTPFNILLLGYGGGSHDGAYLTDSMMVVHVEPKLQKVFLISIPRDIWIKIPTDGDTSSYWKINAAYTIGMDDVSYPNKKPQFKGVDNGGHMAEYVVNQVTGLPINYFLGMDFTGFKNTIDTLGGVDINVETAFTDPEYPVDGKEDDLCGHPQSDLPTLEAEATQSAVETVFPCRYENLHFDAGLQHMDGERALSYTRSRHSLEDGTDFGRAKRQRNLLLAVKQKVFSIGFIPKVLPFTNSLGDDMRTDMSVDDIKTLIQNSSTLNNYQVSTLALTDQNYLKDAWSDDGQWILEPKDGLDNWGSIHIYLTDVLNGKPQPIPAVIQIENGTHIVGLAQLATNRLKNEGLQTLDPITAQDQNVTQTTITVYDKNINQSGLDILKKEFGVQAISFAPSSQTTYNVLITVGEDYNLKEGKKLLNE